MCRSLCEELRLFFLHSWLGADEFISDQSYSIGTYTTGESAVLAAAASTDETDNYLVGDFSECSLFNYCVNGCNF